MNDPNGFSEEFHNDKLSTWLKKILSLKINNIKTTITSPRYAFYFVSTIKILAAEMLMLPVDLILPIGLWVEVIQINFVVIVGDHGLLSAIIFLEITVRNNF